MEEGKLYRGLPQVNWVSRAVKDPENWVRMKNSNGMPFSCHKDSIPTHLAAGATVVGPMVREGPGGR